MRVTSKSIDCVVESLAIRSIDCVGTLVSCFTVSGRHYVENRDSDASACFFPQYM